MPHQLEERQISEVVGEGGRSLPVDLHLPEMAHDDPRLLRSEEFRPLDASCENTGYVPLRSTAEDIVDAGVTAERLHNEVERSSHQDDVAALLRRASITLSPSVAAPGGLSGYGGIGPTPQAGPGPNRVTMREPPP